MIAELMVLLLFATTSYGQFYRLYGDGTYDFNFHTSNDIHRSEVRYIDGTVLGKYAYRAPTGQKIEVQYSAGKHGYRESRKISDKLPIGKSVSEKAAKASQSSKVLLQRPPPSPDQSNSYGLVSKNDTTQPPPTRVMIPVYGRKVVTTKPPPSRLISPNYGDQEISSPMPPETTTEKQEEMKETPSPVTYRNYYNYQQVMPAQMQNVETVKEIATESPSTETAIETKSEVTNLYVPSGYELIPLNATIFGSLHLPIALVAVKTVEESSPQQISEMNQQVPPEEQAKDQVYDYQNQQFNVLPDYPSNNNQDPEQPSSGNKYENQDISDIIIRRPVYFSPEDWMYAPQPEQPQQPQQQQQQQQPEQQKTNEEDLPSGFVPLPETIPLPNSDILHADDEDQDLDIDYRPFVPPAQDYSTPPPYNFLTLPPTPPPTTPKPQPLKSLPPTPYRVSLAHRFKDFIIPYPIVAQNKVLSWGK